MCRSELQVYTKMKSDEIVNLNNTISRLKKQLENYEAESYAQETKKDYSLQVASQKTLEYGQVSLCLHAESSLLTACVTFCEQLVWLHSYIHVCCWGCALKQSSASTCQQK